MKRIACAFRNYKDDTEEESDTEPLPVKTSRTSKKKKGQKRQRKISVDESLSDYDSEDDFSEESIDFKKKKSKKSKTVVNDKDEVSEYEKIRLRNIAEREKKLKELNIFGFSSDFPSGMDYN